MTSAQQPHVLLVVENVALARDHRLQKQVSSLHGHGAAAAWVPSRDRDRSKAALREQWERPELALLRERAQWVYHAFRRPQ